MAKPNNTCLEGIRILDLSRVLAGPFCTQLLGDLGAEVIKIEQPGKGDDTRQWGPPWFHGESAYYLSCNRNKKSVTVNLQSEAGRNLIWQMALHCDVLVENFKVGTMQKWGLGYVALRKRNPRLIYCAITGYGQTGPLAPRPGYDFIIQAQGGIMSITGETDGEPSKVGVAIADIVTGLYALNAILAALFHRERTGEGQF
ncbi:MAG: CaiB/BaiF CoA transferase family protein, partial [bacterium]